MSNATDLVTPENATIELLHELFEAAFLETILDEEQRVIRLKEDVVARVQLSDSKERIQIIAFYGIKEEAQRIDRLELVNRINERFILIRAGIDDDGDLWFDHNIFLKGAATRKAIVQTTRAFLNWVPRAVNDCDEDGIIA